MRSIRFEGGCEFFKSALRPRPSSLNLSKSVFGKDFRGGFRMIKAVIECRSAIRPGSPLYMALGQVNAGIDAIAKLLVGDETFYRAGGSACGSDNRKWRDSRR